MDRIRQYQIEIMLIMLCSRKGRIENGEEESRDPDAVLPSELFSKALDFLPPSSIATSSAIPKDWRMTVNSNPLLHREIDFLHLGHIPSRASLINQSLGNHRPPVPP